MPNSSGPPQCGPSSSGASQGQLGCSFSGSRARTAVAAGVLRAGVSAEGPASIFTPNHNA